MKVCFDTSVLVPALVASHEAHARAIVWVDAASRGNVEGMIAWHGIAEAWSVLTRLPIVPAVTPAVAEKLLERLVTRLKPLPMHPAIYREGIRRATDRGVRSGALFDALHLIAAERAGADVLLTFNPGDFERLAAPDGPTIVVPPDPPRVSR